MALRALALALLGAVVLTACDSGRDYDADKGDDDYDLAAMALRPDDLPLDFEQRDGAEFSSDEWAQIFGADDPEATLRQLEAQGWMKNWVTESTPPRFGKVLNIRSVSTLYTNEAAAKEAVEEVGGRTPTCGLPILNSTPRDRIVVPKMADQSYGFFLEEEIDENGTTLMYTTVCFRTGRIVHVVQEASLPGLEDVADSYRFAQIMLEHVNDAFDGKKPLEDEEEDG